MQIDLPEPENDLTHKMNPSTLKCACARVFQIGIVFALAVYTATYVSLSRTSFAYSKSIGIDGFWFVVSLSDEARRENDFRNLIFWPAVQIDLAIGTGMRPLCNPMITMSGPEEAQDCDSVDEESNEN